MHRMASHTYHNINEFSYHVSSHVQHWTNKTTWHQFTPNIITWHYTLIATLHITLCTIYTHQINYTLYSTLHTHISQSNTPHHTAQHITRNNTNNTTPHHTTPNTNITPHLATPHFLVSNTLMANQYLRGSHSTTTQFSCVGHNCCRYYCWEHNNEILQRKGAASERTTLSLMFCFLLNSEKQFHAIRLQ